MEHIIKTAGVLLFQDNKVLMVRHGAMAGHLNDTYGIPAGRIEPGESSIDAAVRELFEETNLKTEARFLVKVPEEYTAAIERKDGSIKNYSVDSFLCMSWDGELKANEQTIPLWVDIDEVDILTLLPNVKKIIFDALKLKQNGVTTE